MTADQKQEKIILGKWTKEKIDSLLRESWSIDDITSRIDFLSAQFVETDYKESTLIGDAWTPEVFVINLKEVDCFTYLDYTESMRLSRSFADFKENLRNIRYRSGVISFGNRNHFFSDWREYNADHLEDITSYVAGGTERIEGKRLNEKEDGTNYLQGIPVTERDIAYIPSSAINNDIMANLKTGDYAGIYSNKPGLDVSHVGIVINRDNSLFFRHASSPDKYGKIVDQDFKNYISDKPGIVILRPKG